MPTAARSYMPASLLPTVVLVAHCPIRIAPRLDTMRMDSAALPSPRTTERTTRPVDVRRLRARGMARTETQNALRLSAQRRFGTLSRRCCRPGPSDYPALTLVRDVRRTYAPASVQYGCRSFAAARANRVKTNGPGDHQQLPHRFQARRRRHGRRLSRRASAHGPRHLTEGL